MPLVYKRDAVMGIYADAAAKGWVVPTFCAENLTTMEAILAATDEYGREIGQPNLPITVAITNLYSHRSQTTHYTHTRNWRMGLKLFLADLQVLSGEDSPYSHLNVMSHLDHVQYNDDIELLGWDMVPFSSIMYDASALPLDENAALTAQYVKQHGHEIVIEGACDEVADAGGEGACRLTSPEDAARYHAMTGCDFLVVNLGTEHRASNTELTYHGDLAREISGKVGPRLVLHGCSSVPPSQVANLMSDGVCKVNIWTALERDSCPALLEDMCRNAAKVAGAEAAKRLQADGLLGANADVQSKSNLGYFTTSYRQQLVFEEMKKIVKSYLALWYR
ncbi:MAG: class II fructose-bisphosphate aldolase [Armatimonadota bacterium]